MSLSNVMPVRIEWYGTRSDSNPVSQKSIIFRLGLVGGRNCCYLGRIMPAHCGLAHPNVVHSTET
jgi:hypothetical protein